MTVQRWLDIKVTKWYDIYRENVLHNNIDVLNIEYYSLYKWLCKKQTGKEMLATNIQMENNNSIDIPHVSNRILHLDHTVFVGGTCLSDVT